MGRDKIDTLEGWKCDTCHKPWVEGAAIYSIATNEGTKTFRHWDCHTPMDVALKNLRDSLRKVQEGVSVLQHRNKGDA